MKLPLSGEKKQIYMVALYITCGRLIAGYLVQ